MSVLIKPIETVGDDLLTIEASVTHEIKIAGDKTWIGLRATGRQKPGESVEEARERIHGFVDAAVMASVNETVATVQARING